MSPYETGQDVEKSEGQRWLELLGESDLVGTLIPYFRDGRQLYAEEFPILCGEHVRPTFTALESLDSNHPKRGEYIQTLRTMLHSYLNRPAEE